MSPLFQTHRLNDKGRELVSETRYMFDTFLGNLCAICPVGTREFSIVKTKLEEASFFAIKSISSATENQE